MAQILRRNQTSIFWMLGVVLVMTLSSYSAHTTNTKKKSVNYINYTRTINKAESYILQEQYDSAMVMYNKAFSIVGKPLAKSCYTALQLSAFLKDKTNFKKNVRRAMQSGLLPEYFQQDSLLNSFIKEEKLSSYVHKYFKKDNGYYNAGLNQSLLDTILQISKYDDRWKVYYIDSLARVDPDNAEIYDKKYDSIVSELVEEKLMPIIKKHGYPGERLTGVFVNSYSRDPNDAYRRSFDNNYAKLILMHYYRKPKKCNYNDLLLSEVKRGNLPPEFYATFIDFQARFGNEELCQVEYYNEWHRTKDSTKFNSINKRRNDLGLGPFQEKLVKNNRGKKVCRELRKGKYNHIKLFYWCG